MTYSSNISPFFRPPDDDWNRFLRFLETVCICAIVLLAVIWVVKFIIRLISVL